MARLHSAMETHFASQGSLAPAIPAARLRIMRKKRVLQISALAAAALVVLSAAFLWMKATAKPAVLASFEVTADASFTLVHPREISQPSGNHMFAGSRIVLTRGTSPFIIRSPKRM